MTVAIGRTVENRAIARRAQRTEDTGDMPRWVTNKAIAKGTRKIARDAAVLNDAIPEIEVHPETTEVRANGELLTCEPAEVLPMAQR